MEERKTYKKCYGHVYTVTNHQICKWCSALLLERIPIPSSVYGFIIHPSHRRKRKMLSECTTSTKSFFILICMFEHNPERSHSCECVWHRRGERQSPHLQSVCQNTCMLARGVWETPPPPLPLPSSYTHSSTREPPWLREQEGVSPVHAPYTHTHTPGHHPTHNESLLKTLLPRRACFPF